MQQSGHKIQLILIIVTLILTSTTLVFGWVYGATLHSKFQTLVKSPLYVSQEEVSNLREQNKVLTSKIAGLEKVVASLVPSYVIENPTPENSIVTTEIEVPSYVVSKDILIDQKCFEDKNDLNQCVVFGRTDITPTLSVIVKPQDKITGSETENIIFEFVNGDAKVAEFKASTSKLFDAAPVATIDYINNRDFTLSLTIGTNTLPSSYNFDGTGWIDYQKFSKE